VEPTDEEPTPAILHFDCGRVDSAVTSSCTGVADVRSLPPASEDASGLRDFNLGGAAGASFNAEFMRCEVSLASPCDGPSTLAFLIGRRVVHRLTLSPHSPAYHCQLGAKFADWEKQYDANRDLIYETATFRVELHQECGAGAPYLQVARDGFVAGFSFGE
jgi:hypothetical protein